MNKIFNIAIIAHVDHGKTTLVDAILKQTKTFRENQKEMQDNLIMDSNDLEREKGITILAKNTSVYYQGDKINIIDTPGHADFSSEVERVLNMASGALLLVDAQEGPLPQTRFVLKKALESKLKIILLINKIDKKDARPREVLKEIENLFLELAQDEEALNFSVLYGVGRDGKYFDYLPEPYRSEDPGSLQVLFDTIIKEIPNSAINEEKPFQMIISNLDYDNYVGRLCIGKIHQGTLRLKDNVVLLHKGKITGTYPVAKIYTSRGIEREEVAEAKSGDIIALAGIPELTIGQTVANVNFPYDLPEIIIEEPTIKITIGNNTSPFSGQEGKFTTSRQIRERLLKEKEVNLGLKINELANGNSFEVCGRGELHLAVLIETMRREGYELEVSRPQVIYREIDDVVCEPYEEVTIEVQKEYLGSVSEELGKRRAIMLEMKTKQNEETVLLYKMSSQNLIGMQNALLTKTKGTVKISKYLLGYEPKGAKMKSVRDAALVSFENGETFSYSLIKAQERGVLFVEPGTKVYQGMVIGMTTNEQDIDINVCKEKKQTNNRSKGEGVKQAVEPAVKLSLEQYLDLVNDDELLEVTPKSLRLRKRYLDPLMRKRARKAENSD